MASNLLDWANSLKDSLFNSVGTAVHNFTTQPITAQSIGSSRPNFQPIQQAVQQTSNYFSPKLVSPQPTPQPMQWKSDSPLFRAQQAVFQPMATVQQQVAEPFLRGFTFGSAEQLPVIGQNFHPETEVGRNLGFNVPTVAAGAGVGANLLIGTKGAGLAMKAVNPVLNPTLGAIAKASPLASKITGGVVRGGVEGAAMASIIPKDNLHDYLKTIQDAALLGGATGGVFAAGKAGFNAMQARMERILQE